MLPCESEFNQEENATMLVPVLKQSKQCVGLKMPLNSFTVQIVNEFVLRNLKMQTQFLQCYC